MANPATASSQFAAKLARDPFFGELGLETFTEAELLEGGFFEDKLTSLVTELPGFDPRLGVTPWEHLLPGLAAEDGRPPLVLLTTGGFDPPHAGHLAMMEQARQAAEAAGYRVVGGYLSPSHDAYVSTKRPDAQSGAERVEMCREAVADIAWLRVDPWEALYVPTDLNYTDVLQHLALSIRARLAPLGLPIPEVAYVFGGDNAQFSRAFIRRGRGICIGRDTPAGRQRFHQAKAEMERRGSQRTLFVEPAPETAGFSSTAIRRLGWNPTARAFPGCGSRYLVRDEGSAPFRSWRFCDAERLEAARQGFLDDLMAGLEEALAPWTRIQVVTLRAQADIARKAIQPRLSLDPFVRGEANLGVSRSFEMAGLQAKPEQLVARPGSAPLEEQLAGIPIGAYTLLEDDVASGRTLAWVREHLPHGVQLTDILLLNGKLSAGPEPLWDVVDLRDFIPGARHGGLVVRAPGGGHVRVPYLAPYVNLVSRAKLTPGAAQRLSAWLWRANLRFFEAVGSPSIGEMEPAFQGFATAMGWGLGETMTGFCEAHLAIFPEPAFGPSEPHLNYASMAA